MDVIDFLCISVGSGTFQFRDSLRSRSARAGSEAGFSSKMATVFEECTVEV
jgi:hypothetical protein